MFLAITETSDNRRFVLCGHGWSYWAYGDLLDWRALRFTRRQDAYNAARRWSKGMMRKGDKVRSYRLEEGQ